MKKLLMLSTALYFSSAFGQDMWIPRDEVNGPPRGSCASFELGGEAFVAGGVNLEEFKRKLYSYDLEQDDWDDEVGIGGETGDGLERGSAVGFSAAGSGFVALGANASATLKDLWRYNPEDETWTQMADFAGTARTGAIAFSIDDIAYVGTGQDEDGLTDDFYKYDPATNSWTELEDFAGAKRKEAVGFTMGGKGYVGTGRGESGYFADFWEYNPTTDEWSEKAEFPGTPRYGAVGCGVFPSAFIMLGEDNDFDYKDDVWEYNYFGDVWTQRADFPGGVRTQASAITVGSRIFVGLGYDGAYRDDFYEYRQVLGIESEEIKMTAYPNPAVNQFQLSWTSPVSLLTVKIYDTAGKEVTDQFSINQISDNAVIVKHYRNKKSGQYFISVFDQTDFKGTTKVMLL